MKRRVYFVRHGRTALTGPPDRFCGSSDPDITNEGEQELRNLCDGLKKLPSLAAIYSSDMKRTNQSAAILADALGAPVISRPDLREIDFGEWEGLTKAEAQARDPDIYARWLEAPDAIIPPGGVSPKMVAARAFTFAQAIRSETEDILVVTHKTFLRIALCTWLGIDLAHYRRSFDIAPAALACVVFSEDSCRLTLLNWSLSSPSIDRDDI